jgi:hypothetical protein
MATITIKKNGEVRYTNSKRNNELLDKEAGYLQFAPCHVQLEKGVTLRHLFEIVVKDLDLWDRIVGNWCAEIVKEGLFAPVKEISEEDKNKVLELYWCVSYNQTVYDKNDSEICGFDFPWFHIWDKKNKEPFGVDFCSPKELMGLPLVLKDNLELLDYKSVQTIKCKNPTYTLYQIVSGIIWELSWWGPPSERDQKLEEIMSSIEEIDEEGE